MKTIGAILYVPFFTAYCVALIPFVLVSIPLYYLGAPEQFKHFWYNQDRTLASGLWATTQETISSEVGRIAIGTGAPDGWTPKYRWEVLWTKAVARWLNSNPRIWGMNHCTVAIQHADQLDAVDDGNEQ